MATYTQAERLLKIATPLGPDDLLLTGISGAEAISQLFAYQLDLVAENRKEIAFDKLMGQGITVSLELPNGESRYFTGICSRFSEGRRDSTFTHYRMEMVPPLWLLTRQVQSRIFQHVTVPEILKKVLTGLDIAWEIQGTFQPRDYCVQYNESDHAFASRLMEEEGIFYFFKHSKDGHKLVVANSAQSHPDLPEQSKVIFEETTGGVREADMRITEWEKVQELRSGKYTLWDHCFELPHKHLEAEKVILDTVSVGKVKHKLLVNGNDKLEIYQYPGQYAQRFDGIDAGGGEKASEIPKIFDDNKRTVEIRMQQEALPSLVIRGVSDCRQFVSGHKFTLERHFNADGVYVLTSVEHSAELAPDYRSGEVNPLKYRNQFTCIPLALPFCPPLDTPKPVMRGTQTAVVVGPPKEEIFCDKYGRVKVQFHWDREGQYNADSSCWIRVATIFAGKKWGITNIPRIGHEVIVHFEEGDPDRPIIMGSVHNADHMPTGDLPKEKMVSGLKSNSTPGGGGFNGLVMNDTKGKESISLHGQYNMDTTIRNDETHHVINDRTMTVDGKHTETVKKATSTTITEGPFSLSVLANTASYFVKGAVDISYDDTLDEVVTKAVDETYNDTQTTTVKNKITIQSTASEIEIDGKTKITLISGASSIVLNANGNIEISGVNITISGTTQTQMGVGNQSVTCDKSQVALSGAAITGAATGTHTITGAPVKIN